VSIEECKCIEGTVGSSGPSTVGSVTCSPSRIGIIPAGVAPVESRAPISDLGPIAANRHSERVLPAAAAAVNIQRSV
jgi:hypothetical protein